MAIERSKSVDRATRPAELRAPSHKRAKIAARLIDKPLVDLISDATDKASRPILKRHGLNDECAPVSQGQ